MGRVLGSSEDEPMWSAIYIYMEAMLIISLYNQSLSQTSKNIMSFLLYLMFSLQQNLRTRGWKRFCLETEWGRLHM
jgi:hypothetical protein